MYILLKCVLFALSVLNENDLNFLLLFQTQNIIGDKVSLDELRSKAKELEVLKLPTSAT